MDPMSMMRVDAVLHHSPGPERRSVQVHDAAVEAKRAFEMAYPTSPDTAVPKQPFATHDPVSCDRKEIRFTSGVENNRASMEYKPKLHGRSFGENSGKFVKQQRARAGDGDIQAALKLGWSVERLTEMFNRQKAAQGNIAVAWDQPIDDPEILAQLEYRQKQNREHQKMRSERLKVRAMNGDVEAARKLGYGQRRIEEILQNLAQARGPEESRDDNEFQMEHVADDQMRSSTLPFEQKSFQRDRDGFISYGAHDREGSWTAADVRFAPSPEGTMRSQFGSALQIRLQAEFEEARKKALAAEIRMHEAHQAMHLAQQRLVDFGGRLEMHEAASRQDMQIARQPPPKQPQTEALLENRQRKSHPRFSGSVRMPKNRGTSINEAIELD